MDNHLLLAQSPQKTEAKKASEKAREKAAGIPEFLLSNADLDKVKLSLGSLKLSGEPKEILGPIYGGMKAGAEKNEIAGRAYEKAASIMPKCFDYNWGAAVAYEKQKKYADAIGYYKECITLPEGKANAMAYAALGSAYGLDGQYGKALETLKMALDLEPDNELKTKIEKNLKTISDIIKKTENMK